VTAPSADPAPPCAPSVRVRDSVFFVALFSPGLIWTWIFSVIVALYHSHHTHAVPLPPDNREKPYCSPAQGRAQGRGKTHPIINAYRRTGYGKTSSQSLLRLC
jgi:hypothetical protein